MTVPFAAPARLSATAYIRWSSDKQSDSTSLTRQRNAIRNISNELGWTIEEEIRDEGVSAFFGTNLDNGKLGEFIRKCEAEGGHGKAIVVEMISRISRLNAYDATMTIGRMVETGLTVVIADQSMIIDGNSIRNQNKQLEAIVAGQDKAHREISDRTRLVREAWQIMRAEGRPTHCASTCPAWLEMDKKRTRFLAINELSPESHHRIGVVNEIFDRYLEGVGYAGIARILNERGEATFRGGDGWRASSVKAIIHSRAVIGEYAHHVARKPTGEIVPDYFPAIISNEKFAAAHASAHKRVMASHSHGSKVRNLLSHVARCAECGSKMVFINKSTIDSQGVDNTYLRCDSYHRRRGCTSRMMIRYPAVEKAFLDAFLERIIDDQHFISGDDVAQIRRCMADQQRLVDDAERAVKNIGDTIVGFAGNASLMADFQKRLIAASDERDAAVSVMDELREQLEKASGKATRAEHIRRVSDLRGDLRGADRERSEQAGLLVKGAINDVIESVTFDVHRDRMMVRLVSSMGFALGPLAGPLAFLNTVKSWKEHDYYAEGDPVIERYLERREAKLAS